MKTISQNKHVFSAVVVIIFIVLVILLEKEITTLSQVFEPSTSISMALYALGIFIAIEFFIALFSKKIVEQRYVFGLAAISGVVCGFLGMLMLQLLIIKLL